ncbi:MAG: VOC family protein [Chloroflexota bacterium]|nr:VOC family protein [Chloroflexota bacterium]
MTEPMEIYPMAMFPTLSVADIDASVVWYSEKVGFATVFSLPGPDGETVMAHLRWRKHADLLLAPEAGPTQAGRAKGAGVALSFLADAMPIDDLAAELAGRGVEIAEGPVSRPWNVRDFVVLDPDWYRLVFFAPVDTSRDFEDVMGDALQG